MSENTKIEWCDHTWSPWRGCTKVSPGCANCYAEGLAKRFGSAWGGWGKGAPRVLNKDWDKPLRWNCKVSVFPSLCDWLDEEVPIEWLARFLALIHDTPNLDWLLLTKRPEKWEQRLRDVCGYLQSAIGRHVDDPVWRLCDRWLPWNGFDRFRPPENIWVGTSVEDQPRADERIPALLKIPAARRFLSVEPMLGPVDMKLDQIESASGYRHADNCGGFCDFACGGMEIRGGIDWVIVGGESGPGARPCNVDWVRNIVRQCAEAHVPCFVKQLGSDPFFDPPVIDFSQTGKGIGRQTHPKGGDPDEWPEDLRVRQFPEVTP